MRQHLAVGLLQFIDTLDRQFQPNAVSTQQTNIFFPVK